MTNERTITVTVSGTQCLPVYTGPGPITGSRGELRAVFTLDESWAALTTAAVFRAGHSGASVLLETQAQTDGSLRAECLVPAEVQTASAAGQPLHIGLVGLNSDTDARRSTASVAVRGSFGPAVLQSGASLPELTGCCGGNADALDRLAALMLPGMQVKAEAAAKLWLQAHLTEELQEAAEALELSDFSGYDDLLESARDAAADFFNTQLIRLQQIFPVHYGITPYSDILEAWENGQVCVCSLEDCLYYLSSVDGELTFCCIHGDEVRTLVQLEDGSWQSPAVTELATAYRVQLLTNRVAALERQLAG